MIKKKSGLDLAKFYREEVAREMQNGEKSGLEALKVKY
jgi:hypothetical protein